MAIAATALRVGAYDYAIIFGIIALTLFLWGGLYFGFGKKPPKR